MQYIQQLFEMSPSLSTAGYCLLGLGALLGLYFIFGPSRPMNFEMVDDEKVAINVLESDDADDNALWIGAQSAADANVVRLNSYRAHSTYPEGRITGDVAWNVQRALDLNNPNSFAFNTGNDDDAA